MPTIAPGLSSWPPLVLASSSPRRRELLATFGIPFEVMVPDYVETAMVDQPLPAVPLAHATGKATVVAALRPEAMVLGADTVISFRGTLLGKPPTLLAAQAMLLHLAGQEHEVLTGVCLLAPGLRQRFIEVTKVRFRHFDAARAAAYVARVNPLDKAGAYALQEDEGELITTISGSWSNVVGLPLEKLALAFRALRLCPRSL